MERDCTIGKCSKLWSHFIGLFTLLERIKDQAYILELPPELEGIHNVFHVCYLHICLVEEPIILTLEELRVNEAKRVVKEPMTILD